jgi:phytoene dehydrogenase-like protein
MHRYSGNTQGAIYGWDCTPKSLATRLSMETPVPGLFLAGHWTRPRPRGRHLRADRGPSGRPGDFSQQGH